MYIAIIGDVIASRQIEQRGQVQEELLALMEVMNRRYVEDIVSPFTVTTGDEFQALLRPNQQIFQLIDEISQAFLPHTIRFGIGVGEMVTAINSQQSIGADGPAYWQARKAIDGIHKKNDNGITHLAVSLENKVQMDTINALLAACEFIKSKWTDTQQDIFQELLNQKVYQENFENKQIAKRLNVSQSAFAKRLKASGIKIYLRNKQIASILLYEQSKGGGN